MTRHLRIFLALTLALMLGLTGQAMAIARGASGPAGTMVLCTGSGPTIVFVDQSGAPTGPPSYCPDCALGSLADATAPIATTVFVLRSFPAQLPTPDDNLYRKQVSGYANARAPPFFV